jgi:secondary thiamine-phosphate synthase enzyme
MKIITKIIKISTRKELEFIDITRIVQEFFQKNQIKNGFLNVFSKHTTLSIKINENENLLIKDFEWFLKKIVSEKRKYHHDDLKLRENCPFDEPKNGKGHLRCLVLEASQSIPILNKRIQLGKYQRVLAIETSGPRPREIVLQIIGR